MITAHSKSIKVMNNYTPEPEQTQHPKKLICKLSAIVLIFCLLIGNHLSVRAQKLDYVDMNNWSRTGPGNASWNVEPGGHTVLQTVNGDPTFFISDQSFNDVIMQGTIKVATTSDDDYIGIVFGYSAPVSTSDTYYNMVMYDWKQNTQSANGYTGQEGHNISRVDGVFNSSEYWQYFWGHTDTGPGGKFDVLATDYGGSKGWADNHEYTFRLIYSSTQIKIVIDDVTIFDITGSFPAGKVGFYNFSQAQVRYGYVQLTMVGPGQVPPIAQDDHYGVFMNNTLTVNNIEGILANDFDPNLDDFVVTQLSDVSYGILSLDTADGSFVYTPNTGWTGIDTFTYKLTDDDGDSDTATVFLSVVDSNNPPVDIGLSNNQFDNNSPDNTVIGTLTTTDPDPYDWHEYLLIDNGGGRFDVSGDEILVADSANMTPGTYSITVRTTDLFGLYYDKVFMMDALFINDAPTIDIIPDPLAILEDEGLQTILMDGISYGFPDPPQTISIDGISSNTLLIPDPSINYVSPDTSGSLSYTPVPDANGTALIAVTIRDDGGTANGGVDSTQVTFTVEVTPVNDPPVIAAIPNPAPIPEDSGQQTVNMNGIGDGDPETTQNLSVTAYSSDVNLIPDPTVNYTPNNTSGTLNYTPVPDANGIATITVTVTDDGGTANGGLNSTTITFDVELTPVNDPPVADAGQDQSVTAGELVMLDGSASYDIDGDSISFLWTPPGGIILSDPTAKNPTFTSPTSCDTTDFTFSLVVDDGEYTSPPDDVIITALPSPPDIYYDPVSFTDNLVSGTTSPHVLSLKNQGYCNLIYTITPQASWIEILSKSEILFPGDSVDINIQFNATSLYAGTYNADIQIACNDPDEALVQIPVALTVTGEPFMVVSADSLDFGNVYAGQSEDKSFTINNTGTDSLHVFSIISDHMDFVPDFSTVIVPPGTGQNIVVTFSPVVAGYISGQLNINSDHPGKYMDSVYLSGTGVDPPVIAVNPGIIDDSLMQNQISQHNLVVKNNGGSTLNFNISQLASWITVLPTGGTLEAGDSLTMVVTINSGNLGAINYSSEITFLSNDPLNPNLDVPVSLTVLIPLGVSVSADPTAICAGGSSQLNAVASGGFGNYTYNWTSIPAGFTSTIQNPVVSPAQNTTYHAEVSDGQSIVSGSVAITVFAATPPSAVSNMLPADNSFDEQIPIQFSWAPATNAYLYDLYIWLYDDPIPGTPFASNLNQINYTYTGGPFTLGDTCMWQVVAKNPCLETPGPVQTFSIKSLPELHVTGITTSQAQAGQPMTISWTVQNDGESETPPGVTWYDRVWITPDLEVRIGEPEDILLGQFPNVSYLDVGESYLQTQQLQMPDNLLGTYFIFVITDALDAIPSWPPEGPPLPYTPPPYYMAYSHGGSYVNVVQEISDNPPRYDNFFYTEITFDVPPLPDLIVTSIIKPDNVFSGQPMSVSWTVKNNGDGTTAVDTWKDRIYFDADSIFNIATAVSLGTFTHTGLLNPDSIYSRTESVITPENIFGAYYVFITTDVTNTVFENVYESNNTLESDSVHVFLTPPPDFVVTQIVVPDTISNKGSFTVEWTVLNQGASSPVVSSWYDAIYLTTSPTYDLSNAYHLGNVQQNIVLWPDSSYYSQKVVSLNHNISGPYYLYIETDLNNDVFEYLNEDNNILRSDTLIEVINPDLVVTNIVMPSADSTGQPFNLQWSVRNDGPGTINDQYWTDKIAISRHPVYHPDSIISVNTLSYTANLLLPGETMNKQKFIALPDNLYGHYYLYIFTDFNNTVFEGVNENNNVLRSDTTIDVSKPDLMVSNIIIPSADSTGQAIAILWTVSNVGSGTVFNRNWTDKILISYNATFDPFSAIEIGTLNYDGYLLPGSSITKQKNLQLPEQIPGPYYIYIHSDCNDTIFENFSESNNIARSSTTIDVLRPDLVVSGTDIPSVTNSGEPLSITWNTTNEGPVSIVNGDWSDYVMLSEYSTYGADSVTILDIINYSGSLVTGDSIVNQSTINIPEGLTGTWYLFIFTDFHDQIGENIGESNNLYSVAIQLTIGPWADLQVTAIQLADSSVAGSNIPFSYTAGNYGTKNIEGTSWKDKVYISDNPAWNPPDVMFLRQYEYAQALEMDSSYAVNSSVNIPSGLSGGNYYIYVYADKENTVFEHTDENNNVLRSNPIYISELPPVDLAMMNVVSPETANSGESVNISWTVENLGVSQTIDSWYDAAYLSTDSIWNKNTDLLLKKYQHFGSLNPGESYFNIQSLNLPDGISGTYYLLMVADYNYLNNDIDLLNNFKARTNGNNVMQTIIISLTPPPDLIVTSLTAPAQVTTGVPFKIYWEVKNEGIGPVPGTSRKDNIYLSTDFTINTGDQLVGTKTRTGGIPVNQSYTDSLEISFPGTLSGNYILIMKTDYNNTVFELDENNNTNNSFIILNLPPPADLFVSEIVSADTAYVGDGFNVQWKIKNIGQNQASGAVKDLIFFSTDPVWDINDVFFGEYQANVSLGPDEVQNRSLTAKVSGLSIGDYYIIVRTDILNNIYESDDDNNASASFEAIFAEVQELPLNVLTSDNLLDFENLYFRIEIADSLNDETMLTTLKGDSIFGSNEMYLKHNQISTRMDFDFSHSNPYQGNQEIIVPSVEDGNYYMLLYGNTLAGNNQDINVFAEILDFEIRSIDPEIGGNKGQVTLRIDGSKFDPLMEVRLENNNFTIIANNLIFVDYSRVFAVFDLAGTNPGVYNIVAEKTNQETVMLNDAFEIIDGVVGDLGINVIAPPNARANRITSFTLEYANVGNTDLINPEVIILSETGAPIAFTVEELPNNLTEMIVPLTEENGPPGVLRPGAEGSIVIYTKTTAGLGFIIKL